MGKMKKRKLCWEASESQQVAGYRIYWATDGDVNYDSPFAKLGNVTEVVIPDDIAGFSHKGGPIEFGVTAVDELGNESDLTTFKAPYQFNIPQAPGGVWIESLDEFHTGGEKADEEEPAEPTNLFAMDAESTVENDTSAAPTEVKDAAENYGSTQIYPPSQNNTGTPVNEY